MFKKKMFSVLSLMMAMAMLLMLPAYATTATVSTSSSQSSSTEPMKVVQLDVFSASTASTTAAGVYDNTYWGKILKEQIGVSLNILPTGDKAQEKLQALMAGGELPDIVIFNSTKDVENAIRANMLVNLDDYLAKLPNVVKYAAKSMLFFRDNISAGTGKAYAVASGVGPAELGTETSWGPYIRWDLYKAAGSPIINTFDDYLTTLKKMQDLQPTTADGKKVYGITLWKDWDSTSMFLATEIGPTLGIDCGDQLGQLPFLQVDFTNGATMNTLDQSSQYMQALKFYYKANQLGLVDPDSLTQTWDTAKSKLTEGRVLFSWWDWYNDNYDTTAHTNGTTPTGFKAVFPANAKMLMLGDNNIGNTKVPIAISSATKNLDACLRFVDFLYSTDGLQVMINGKEGTTWKLENGKPTLTADGWKYANDLTLEMADGGKWEDGRRVLGFNGLSLAFINPKTTEPLNYKLWTSSKKNDIENQTKVDKDWTSVMGYQYTIDYVVEKNLTVAMPLAKFLITPISDDISALASKIGDIVKTYSWRMIFAKNDTEYTGLYNEMITKAEGLGLKTVYDSSLLGWENAQALAEKYK